ncbi:MAG: glutathione ABC transporter permease [Candidatus Roseilinea sp.]|nr:MAG: glutathione ABC transporter permease [Candidatus Roseilinea sp.]
MIQYLVRRVLWILITLFCVSVITFTLVLSAPGDPARALAGSRADELVLNQIREQYGLDQPIYIQYARYMQRLLGGDLGYSYAYNRPVAEELSEKLRPTALLAFSIIAVALLIGIPLGVFTAQRSQSKIGQAVNILGLTTISIPAFVFGLLLIYVLGYSLRWFPIGGYGTINHLVLPTLTVAIPWSVWYANILRTNLLSLTHIDFVRTAHAKGLQKWAVTFRHMLPNALVPVVTMVSMDLAALLTGLAIVEYVFNWPGVGWMAVRAALSRDIPVVMAAVLLGGLFIGLGNLVADLLVARLDPRVRLDN